MPDTVTLPDVWPTDETELAALIGSVAAREFLAGTPYQQLDAWKAMQHLAAAGDTGPGRWIDYAMGAITDSARMESFKGNWEALHSVCSFAYVDGKRRDAARGIAPECHRHSRYAMAHRQAMRDQGYPQDVPGCRCDPVRP